MVGQTDNYAKRLYVEEEDSVADEGSKRRKSGHGSAPHALGAKDTVYRYVCPGRKAGRIIGRGGEIVRQLMASTGARIMIGDSIPGCDERLVTICSSSDGLAASGNTTDYACPAQDALFRVHEKLVGSETPGDEDFDADSPQVSVRLLVPSDQVGQIIGKGGQTIHSIRNDSEALVHIFKNEHIPLCANSSDELVQITGDAPAIRKALFQVSSILHKIPSHIQNLQDDTVYRYLCTERSIGSIIGKGGETVKKLRADTQAKITIGERVHGGKERVVTIFSCSEKTNIFGDMGDYVCPAQDALFRLHEKLVRNDPPADEDVDVEPHDSVCLLVPYDQIGHIIGKGGHAIRDIQNSNGVNIRILKGGNLPPCASCDDELLQMFKRIFGSSSGGGSRSRGGRSGSSSHSHGSSNADDSRDRDQWGTAGSQEVQPDTTERLRGAPQFQTDDPATSTTAEHVYYRNFTGDIDGIPLPHAASRTSAMCERHHPIAVQRYMQLSDDVRRRVRDAKE